MPMSWIRKNTILIIYYLWLIFIFYLLFFFSLYLISVFTLRNGIVINSWPFLEYQKNYYFAGYRKIWQKDVSCIKVDAKLIYSPKLGECHFKNPEFNTTLNFDKSGRMNAISTNFAKKGIAVLGDSFSMGWGVNNDETFSSLLQSKINKPVYNLGVASYGTYREIEHLLLSNLLDKVDTLIIQYCDNDLEENIKMINDFDFNAKLNEYKKSLNQTRSNKKLVQDFFKYIKFALMEPISKVSSLNSDLELENNNFDPHFKAFNEVIKFYAKDLNDKKIIVFYCQSNGKKFHNFPVGQDPTHKNIYFFDLNLNPKYFYKVDGHLNVQGHKEVANSLFKLIHDQSNHAL